VLSAVNFDWFEYIVVVVPIVVIAILAVLARALGLLDESLAVVAVGKYCDQIDLFAKLA
jgi:hypothetical protein